MFAEERKKEIVEYVNEKKSVTVPDLCETFSVSSATIRNDLRDLDDAGLINRTHGGAMRRTRARYEPDMDFRAGRNMDAKKQIASEALELIEDGDTIILDTGTTVGELAKKLVTRSHITVVTNDIKIASILEKNDSCDVLIVGGLLRKGFHCTVGHGMFSDIDALSVDKAFLGANSFSSRRGASTPDLAQSEIKKKMISIADRVILLCDRTKLETDAFINFAGPSDIDVLVTDTISPELLNTYKSLGIEVRYHE